MVKKKSVAKKKVKPAKKVKSVKKIESKKKEPKQLGHITNYFKQVKAAAILLNAPLKIGDKIKIVGGENEFEMTVDSMQIDREDIVQAKKGDEVGVLVPQDVHKGYRVYMA